MRGSGGGDIVFAEESFRIQGALFEVYRTMGAGFLESVYQECLTLELAKRDVPFVRHPPLPLTYKGEPLRQIFVADFICYERIILELKAVRAIAPEHRAQAINYLRATGMKLAVLANFGATPKVEIERFAL